MHLQVGHGQVDQGRGLPGGGHRVHRWATGPGGSRESAARWGSQSTQLGQVGHGQVDQQRGLSGGVTEYKVGLGRSQTHKVHIGLVGHIIHSWPGGSDSEGCKAGQIKM